MTQIDIERARFNMIEQQVRTWDVLDQRILDLIRDTPREKFVPPAYKNLAFSDLMLPLPHGQVMMEPKVEARILQAVDLTASERALEIGTGTGYLAACLAKMGRHVTTVDIFPEFREMAEKNLGQQRIGNVTFEVGDAAAGWDDGWRYDAIVVTASLPQLHEGFHHSLTVGGRLFVVVGEPPVMEALLITRYGESQWAAESLFETQIPALVNAPRQPKFAL